MMTPSSRRPPRCTAQATHPWRPGQTPLHTALPYPDRPVTGSRSHPRMQGFGAVLAIVVVVVLSVLVMAMSKLISSQASNAALDVVSARAWQAAKAGTEWGLYQALQPSTGTPLWGSCSSAAQDLDLRSQTGFVVSVSCDSWPYNEGSSTSNNLRVFRIRAVACNTTGSHCPDDTQASNESYVERTRQVIATN